MRACDACTKSLVVNQGWKLTISKEQNECSDTHEFLSFDACDHKCMAAILQAVAVGAVIGETTVPFLPKGK